MKTGLFHPLSLAIGLRYAGAKRQDRFVSFISLFSTVGIALGVAALMVVLSVMNGFEGQLKGRILGVVPHLLLTGSAQRLDSQQVTLDLRQLPHYVAHAPLLQTEGMLQSASQLRAVQVQGIDADLWPAGDVLRQHFLAGDLNSLRQARYQVVLGQGLAAALNVGVGDTLRLTLTEGTRFTPFGRVPAQRVFTVSGIFALGADVDNQVALIALTDGQRLLRWPSTQFSGLRVWLDDPFAVDAALSTELPAGLQWQDWRRERGELFQAVAMEKRLMGLMLMLIIAVASFNILSALVMVVSDKAREIAILRTMGLGEGAIVQIFLVLGAASGVLGSALGAALGLALCVGLNPLLSGLGLNLYLAAGGAGLPVVLLPAQLALIALGAVALSFSATLYPAWRAARLNPAEALRHE
ncbi:MAG: lipoprotein-releasing ABC transporter permease subunit [Aeromonas sp.]